VAPYFRIGRPPHTLWGDITLARTTATTAVPSVLVEILDGTNAGKATIADANGRFRFDDLVASPTFTVRLSKERYLTRPYGINDFRHNLRQNFQIEAE